MLQIVAAPNLHPPGALGLADFARHFSAAFEELALCLAGDRGTSDNPTDEAPKRPAHHSSAFCCFWHGNSGIAVLPDAKLELVSFGRPLLSFPPSEQAWRRRLTGSIGARAPPLEA